MPFLVDPSGVYIRREGLAGHYICGASPGSVSVVIVALGIMKLEKFVGIAGIIVTHQHIYR